MSPSPSGAQHPGHRPRTQHLSAGDTAGYVSVTPIGAQQQQQQQQQQSMPSGTAAAPHGATWGLDDPLYGSDLFRIHCFKILPCGKRYAHDWMRCPFRHPGEKAARRPLTEGSWYSATMCPDLRGASCPRGDACGFAHNVFEHWLHPDRYRTQLCRDGAACSRRVCFFAHSIQQLRTPSGRVIPAAESAEAAAAAAAVAAEGWAVPGTDVAAAAGLRAAPLGNCASPALVDGFYSGSGPPGDIVFVPLLRNGVSPGAAPAAVVLPNCATNGLPYGVAPTSLSAADVSSFLQRAAGYLADAAAVPPHGAGTGHVSAACWPATPGGIAGIGANLAGPPINTVFQVLMHDASHMRSEADAAAEAATRAQAAASEAAALINKLVLTGQQPPSSSDGGGGSGGETSGAATGTYDSGSMFAGPEALLQAAQLRGPLGRRTASANGMALDASPPGTVAFVPGSGGGPLMQVGPSGGSGPLLRFLSADPRLAAPLPPPSPAVMMQVQDGVAPAPGALPNMAAQLPPRGAPQGSPVVWHGSL